MVNLSQLLPDQNFSDWLKYQTILVTASTRTELAIFEAFLQTKSSQVTFISPDQKDSIKIEPIRQILAQSTTKRQQDHYFVFKDADKLTLQAQNALLKILEEPIAKLHFVLLTIRPNQLLITIRSRTTKLSLPPVPDIALKTFLQSHYPDLSSQKINQLLFILKDDIQQLLAVIADKNQFEALIKIATDAKIMLQNNIAAKLELIQNYQDRQQALKLIEIILKICQNTYAKNPTPNLLRQMQKWRKASQYLNQNATTKLILTEIVVE